jgi:ubiquitin-protein ligase
LRNCNTKTLQGKIVYIPSSLDLFFVCVTPFEDLCFTLAGIYPEKNPMVNIYTTGNGNVRFNPNLYADGKVCLSLLGTWRADAGESWIPGVSTILQILVSIQSLVLISNPYFCIV